MPYSAGDLSVKMGPRAGAVGEMQRAILAAPGFQISKADAKAIGVSVVL
jgi:hypothetical protein